MDLITIVLIGVACFIGAYIFLDRICKCIQYVAICKAFAACSGKNAESTEKEIKGFVNDLMNMSKGKAKDGE
ncbi:MAG: hypothetical protein LIO96_07900 [Lachnospiraceae bacterium]|nr:hypothetical protein [Lachnospiraceae bacterium]